jgi:hypothetical protein
MFEGEVREYERRADRHGFGLAQDVPLGGQPGDVARESLFDAAVEPARLIAGEDRVLGLQAQPTRLMR